MQCVPGERSSARRSTGLRSSDTRMSPGSGLMRPRVTTECGIDMCSGASSFRNAHRSTTWPPCVFTTRIDWPALSGTAAPRRAGITTRGISTRVISQAFWRRTAIFAKMRVMDLFNPATYEAVRRPLLEAETLPVACYTSEEFFRREIDTIFMKVWNFIGRVDYIPKAGDY